jgi:hypothetical protein
MRTASMIPAPTAVRQASSNSTPARFIENLCRRPTCFLDNRPLPIDPQPIAPGYSTAHWDGEVLVVMSNGFADGVWLDRAGSPLTSSAKITERFRRPDFGHLEVTLTVDDPKAYTAPWTVTLKQNIAVDTELLNYYCMENERDESHLVGK